MKCFQIFINVNLTIFQKKKIRLEKLCFLPNKCIYLISYRNEHPVFWGKLYLLVDQIYLLGKETKPFTIINRYKALWFKRIDFNIKYTLLNTYIIISLFSHFLYSSPRDNINFNFMLHSRMRNNNLQIKPVISLAQRLHRKNYKIKDLFFNLFNNS
jgi:hypothetical protein